SSRTPFLASRSWGPSSSKCRLRSAGVKPERLHANGLSLAGGGVAAATTPTRVGTRTVIEARSLCMAFPPCRHTLRLQVDLKSNVFYASAMAELTISQVGQMVGLRASAIRYYEAIGVLAPAARASGQRRYDMTAVYRLTLVQRARAIGFTLDEIRGL